MKKVLDTNAILYLLGGKLAQPLLPAQYFVSVISEMELLSYPSLDEVALAQIRGFLSDVTVVDLSEQVRELAIGLRRQHVLKPKQTSGSTEMRGAMRVIAQVLLF